MATSSRFATSDERLSRQRKERPRLLEWFRLLRQHRFAMAGFILLLFILLVAILAPLLAPHDPTAISGRDRLRPPGSEYWLGTDYLGRDVLSRLIYGARISLSVGAMTVFLCNLAGITIGLVAGYYRKIDNVLMRIMDALMAFPPILLALGIMAALGPSLSNIVIALSVVYTPLVARVTRSTVLVIRDIDYVDAARALGINNFRILWRHVLPNCVGPIIVQATFIFAYAVISEAALSFLGVGVSPEIPTWGNMLSDARQYMRQHASLAILPGAAIMITVLALNLLGDGLRDILDPHSRER